MENTLVDTKYEYLTIDFDTIMALNKSVKSQPTCIVLLLRYVAMLSVPQPKAPRQYEEVDITPTEGEYHCLKLYTKQKCGFKIYTYLEHTLAVPLFKPPQSNQYLHQDTSHKCGSNMKTSARRVLTQGGF